MQTALLRRFRSVRSNTSPRLAKAAVCRNSLLPILASTSPATAAGLISLSKSMYVHLCMPFLHVSRGIWRGRIRASRMRPRMPFPEQETAPASDDRSRNKGNSRQTKNAGPGGCLRRSTSYQALTRRLNDLAQDADYAASRDGGLVWIICGFPCAGR
jgi:hypothetical protein